ncbi:tetratricopeptide repeat protein [Bradyrhizobium vignae]|uniref:tetratricopeptide repeat protein n=1 Tax=Bradyrhizobium vignae TaxID=1549949 RepID=UPI001FD7D87C|nr:tetratricopeptide repeat protein [Bradyrhizobium vignae]
MVVLPFANIGGDPEQDYFVDGVTESLTTDLSRIRGLFVIGRHTAFSYKGKSIDLKQIGRELHVLYVLEGSVQRSANQLRVNVQFVDAESGAHLWADRFDKPICDLFEMQDEIVSRLANALNAQLIAAEARRSEHSLHPSALDLYFQCMARWNKGVTPAHMAQARSFFERALELDPDNVEALVGIGAVDVTRAGFFLADGRAFCRGRGGLEQGDILGAAACPCSRIFGFCLIVYQTRDGRHRGMRARVGIKPEFGGGPCFHWLRQSLYRTRQRNRGTCTQGDALVSRDEGTYRWMTWVGFSKLLLGADAEAVVWFRRGLNSNPNNPIAHLDLAAALAHLGKLDEARASTNKALALNPTLTIRRLRSIPFSDDPTFREQGRRVIQGMRLAGVPEE